MSVRILALSLLTFLCGCSAISQNHLAQARPHVVYISDSILYFMDQPAPRSPGLPYPGLCAASNTCKPGDTLAYASDETQPSMDERFEADGIANCQNPCLIVLEGGTDDIVFHITNGGPETLSDLESGVMSIIGKAKAANIPLVILNVIPVDSQDPRFNSAVNPVIAGYNAWLTANVPNTSLVSVADVHSSVADQSGNAIDGMLVDAFHPSFQGYTKMTKPMLDAMNNPLLSY